MNKRQQSKANTRQLILNKTALLLQEVGFLRVSSKEISRVCEVSQGTIFLHFQTKENLLLIIISDYLVKIEDEIGRRCIKEQSSEDFLKAFFDVYTSYEGMLSRIYKDLSYFPESIKKRINSLNTLVKNLFFDNIRFNTVERINIVETFISIDAFYAQIERNLVEKETYSAINNVIKQKKGRLLKLYKLLFE